MEGLLPEAALGRAFCGMKPSRKRQRWEKREKQRVRWGEILWQFAALALHWNHLGELPEWVSGCFYVIGLWWRLGLWTFKSPLDDSYRQARIWTACPEAHLIPEAVIPTALPDFVAHLSALSWACSHGCLTPHPLVHPWGWEKEPTPQKLPLRNRSSSSLSPGVH